MAEKRKPTIDPNDPATAALLAQLRDLRENRLAGQDYLARRSKQLAVLEADCETVNRRYRQIIRAIAEINDCVQWGSYDHGYSAELTEQVVLAALTDAACPIGQRSGEIDRGSREACDGEVAP